jgi:hypothetical protein
MEIDLSQSSIVLRDADRRVVQEIPLERLWSEVKLPETDRRSLKHPDHICEHGYPEHLCTICG